MAIDTAIPGLSRGGTCGSRDSGTNAAAIAMDTAATGTMAQKTLCQAKCSSSQPPTTGPVATPTPVAAPQMPRAAARSRRSVNALAMIDSVAGKITAAQAPAANRVATSAPDESASAEAALARPKPSRPRISAGRRPNRSDRLPAASTSAAKARL